MILADLPQYKNENLVSSNYLLPIVRFVSEQVKRILGSLTGMRNICFLLVPDFEQHLKIEFLKLCLYASISFSGRCPKGWQDGVDEGLGCIWAEVCPVRSYSVPSIYHLLQTNKGTSGIITCICISNKYQNLRWCDSF